jgi:hypothetical protein
MAQGPEGVAYTLKEIAVGWDTTIVREYKIGDLAVYYDCKGNNFELPEFYIIRDRFAPCPDGVEIPIIIASNQTTATYNFSAEGAITNALEIRINTGANSLLPNIYQQNLDLFEAFSAETLEGITLNTAIISADPNAGAGTITEGDNSFSVQFASDPIIRWGLADPNSVKGGFCLDNPALCGNETNLRSSIVVDVAPDIDLQFILQNPDGIAATAYYDAVKARLPTEITSKASDNQIEAIAQDLAMQQLFLNYIAESAGQ